MSSSIFLSVPGVVRGDFLALLETDPGQLGEAAGVGDHGVVAHLGVLRVDLVEADLVACEKRQDDVLHPRVVLLVDVGIGHHGSRAQDSQLASACGMLVKSKNRTILKNILMVYLHKT